MKLILPLLALVVAHVRSTHLVVGDFGQGAELVHSEVIQYNAIPFKKRVKFYFYTQEDQRKIVGIQALDNLQSKATMNITAGGVGHTYVNVRMKSERGRGLEYALGVYAALRDYADATYAAYNRYPSSG